MVAPNGARLSKADHWMLPITAQEIVETACRCEEAGAMAIHVHVRDAAGSHSICPVRYGDVTKKIADATTLRIQVSTESAGIFDVPAQYECLSRLADTEASVSLREISRSPEMFEKTYSMAEKRGVDIQHILYDADEVTALLQKFDKGEIPEQNRRAIFVLGRYAQNQQSSIADLTAFLDSMGDNQLRWSVCAFGQAEHDCLLAALELGGHARIGFENNYLAPDGQVFDSNEASVAAFVDRAAKAGFSPVRGAL